jgi:sugar lactone lactonase YvrE
VRQDVGRRVNPIAFSPGGRLFVARPDTLYELDPGLARPPRAVLRHVGPLNGMAFGPDGQLYAPVYTRGEVVRIDVDARTVEPVATGFEMPAAVKFDREGRLHLVDHATGCVWRLDPARELLARLDPPVDNLAFDARGRLFVSHSGGRAVLEVLPGGGTRRVIAPAR